MKGTLAEWLGTSLQNSLQWFESARYLPSRFSQNGFFCVMFLSVSRMDFNLKEIVALYGTQFFTMRPVEPQANSNRQGNIPTQDQQMASAPAPSIGWANRPNARVTLIISRHEKSTEEFMTMLKKMVEFIQMPVDYISFGFYDAQLKPDDLKGMQTPYGVFFGSAPNVPKQQTFEPEHGKVIYFLPFLSQIRQNKNYKIELVETMKKFLN